MIAFQVGPFAITYYGIMITSGIIAATVLAYLEARRRQYDAQHVVSLLLLVLPLGIIGARAYHVIDQWSYYSQHPAQILGGAGLGIFGALAGGAIGLIVYALWRRLSPLAWLDVVAPGVILAQAIGRWGNYFNQELYGYPTDLSWGVYIDPANRLPGYEAFTHFQPLFFYEFLWNLSGCILLLFAARKWQRRLLNGDIFFLYLIYYGVGRFLLEGLKIDVWTVAGIPMARWVAGTAIATSAAAIFLRHHYRRSEPLS